MKNNQNLIGMKKITFILVILISFIQYSLGQGTWSQITMPEYRTGMSTALNGSKIFVAGGNRGNNPPMYSKTVDIYDLNTQMWDSSAISVKRQSLVGVSCGSKVLFAGGSDFSFLLPIVFSEVDIYDTLTQQWTTEQLSIPRAILSAESYGNEVIFAGGMRVPGYITYATVDKYNVQTGLWSVDSLSEPRHGMGSAVLGNKAFFAGGAKYTNSTNLSVASNKVDIYDFSTGIWTTDTLSMARLSPSAVAVGNKLIIAGGTTASNTPTDRVDIYDITTGIWTTSSLSTPRTMNIKGVTACGKAFFIGGGAYDLNTMNWLSTFDIVDIYDPATNTWSIEHVPSGAVVNHGVEAKGNQVFSIGGHLGPFAINNKVDVYTCSPVGIENVQNLRNLISLYPNPANENVFISYPSVADDNMTIVISDITGKIVSKKTSASQSGKMELDIMKYENGVYLIQIQTSEFVITKKLIVE